MLPNSVELITNQITKKINGQISLSRKAGMAVFGFEKVKSVLKSNENSVLIQAIDGSKREKKRISVKTCQFVLSDCLTGSELGIIFGRERVIHCAVLESDFTENIIFNANRLKNLKNPVPQ